jgi:hypothetical protein
MVKFISISAFLLFFSYAPSFSQIIILSGKVTDKNTGLTLPGATVRTGSYGTSTNGNGEFYLVVDKAVANQHGISVSFVGYQRAQVAINGTYSHIDLIPSPPGILKEVVISGHGETILAKAIRKIPENYPAKDFMMVGRLQMIHTAKDTSGVHYFYENQSALKLYYPSYTENKPPQVSLVQKTDTLIDDPKSTAGMIRWVDGYNGFAHRDYVHGRSGMLSGNHLKTFHFVMNGKEWLNGRRVYVINFYAKTKKDDAGILYIDTGTYAFVRIINTTYNIKPLIFIPIAKAASIVDYIKINGKWYLYTVKINNISRHNQLDLYRMEEFHFTGIDTANVKPLPFSEVIPAYAEDRKVNQARVLKDVNVAPFFLPLIKRDTVYTKIAFPEIDTSPPKKKNPAKSIYAAYINYLLNDNVRLQIQVSNSPADAAGYQPLLAKFVTGRSNFALGLNFQFRLYKELFFQLDGQQNYGIGGIKDKQAGYHLIYNFELNKTQHPISLSPLFGYSNISLSDKKTDYYTQNSWVFGLYMSYYIGHRWAVYLGEKYYNPVSTINNSGLRVGFHHVTTNAGLLFKLKL